MREGGGFEEEKEEEKRRDLRKVGMGRERNGHLDQMTREMSDFFYFVILSPKDLDTCQISISKRPSTIQKEK